MVAGTSSNIVKRATELTLTDILPNMITSSADGGGPEAGDEAEQYTVPSPDSCNETVALDRSMVTTMFLIAGGGVSGV